MISIPNAVPVTWPSLVALLLTLAAVLFLPGFLLSTLWLRRTELSWLARLAIAIVLSMALGIACSTIVLALNQPLSLLLILIGGVSAAAGLGLAWSAWRRGHDSGTPPVRLPPAHPLLVGVFIALTLWMLLRFAAPIDRMPAGNDFWSYASYVRKWATWDARPAVHVLFGTSDTANFRYIYGGWPLVQSLITAISGVDSVDLVGLWLPPVLMCAAYLAHYAFAETLFRSRNAAMLSNLAFSLALTYTGGTRDSLQRVFFMRINEDKFLLPFILVPIALLFLVRYLRDKRRGDWAGFVLMAIGATLTHPLGLVQLGLSAGLFAALHLLLNRDRQTLVRLMALFVPMVLLLAIPFTQRSTVDTAYSTDTEEGQTKYQGLHQDRLSLLDAESNRYMVNGKMLGYPVTIAALALTPLLLIGVKKDWGAQFLLANMVGLIFVLFNPLLTPLLGRIITPWMLWRLTYLFPSALVVGYMLDKGMGWLRQRAPRLGELGLVAAPLAVLLVALVALKLGRLAGWPALITEYPYAVEADLLVHARALAKQPSTFMVPLPLDTLTPAFVPQGYVPSTRRSEPRASYYEEMRIFYDAQTIGSEMWEILTRNHCDYVVLGKNQLPTAFWVSPLLKALYANDTYVLFELADAQADHPLLVGNSAFASADWEDATAAYREAPGSLPAQLRLLSMADKRGRSDEVERAAQELLAAHGDSPWVYLTLADLARLDGEPRMALQYYEQALRRSTNDLYFSGVPTNWIQSLVKRGMPGLTAVPAAEHERWGVGVNKAHGDIAEFPIEWLRLGWYIDWEIQERPNRRVAQEHVQTLLVSAAAYPPNWDSLARALRGNAGSIWLVGMSPESEMGGARTPAEFAEAYHDAYQAIKSGDPTALVAAGGITEPTPLRLQWLDAVLEAYEDLYHERLPADAWHINDFILREKRGDWGAGIPVGLDADEGELYELADTADADILAEHVVAFRRWMAAHGERGKPLIISAYGSQMPSDYIAKDVQSGNERIREFMRASFDFFRTATDDEIGYPADGNRLVQRWAWYSLNEPPYDVDAGTGGNGMLFTPADGEAGPQLTTFGSCFQDYVTTLGE